MDEIMKWVGIIIAAGAALAAISVWVIKPIVKLVKKIKGLTTHEYCQKQSSDIAAQISSMKAEIISELRAVRSENTILFKGTHASLRGLVQLKCNGPVTECLREYDQYLQDTFAER